jgi:hypothetical protein
VAPKAPREGLDPPGNASPVEVYLAAHAAHQAADRAVTDLLQTIQRIAAALADKTKRGQLVFHGTGIGLPWPVGAANHAIPVVDGEWPEASRLQTALAQWHATHAAARAAWDVLPPQFQPSLPHPPAALRTDKLPSEDSLMRNKPRPSHAEE